MKNVTVFFDLEGQYGAHAKFDSEENIEKILSILDKFQIKGVFNVCGVFAEQFPKSIRKLHEDAHEVSSHGYAHEDFSQLKANNTHELLARTERILEDLTGEKPTGLRPPWLKRGKQLYSIADKRGYMWVSSSYVPQPEHLLRAHHVRFKGKIKVSNRVGFQSRRLVASALALFYRKAPFRPFKSRKLYEIPLFSTTDYNLLGSALPNQESPEPSLKFAYEALKKQFDKSRNYFNLNFHAWLIGSSNRPLLLEEILSYISKKEVKFLLARQLISSS